MILQQQVPFKVRGIAKPSVPVRIQLRREPFDNRPVSPLDQQYGLVFDVEVEILKPDERLKPGMTVSCEFL